jgi:Glucodextranase, domain B
MEKETFPTRHPVWTVVLTLLSVVIVIAAIGGCSDNKDTKDATDTQAAAARKASKKVADTLRVDTPARSTYHTKVTITGAYTSAGPVQLLINGRLVETKADGTFSGSASLAHLGDNPINVNARFRDGEKNQTVFVRRKQSAAQRAAAKRAAAEARARAAREAAEAKAREARKAAEAKARRASYVANWKASAVTLPYNQLEKNADRYEGKRVKYTGKIFQIQEDSLGGIMLLSVTDEGYDFWTDNVWINYDHRITSAEDDIVTVYGTVVGSKSYETQIGGETYVPEIDAKYIDS